MVFLAFAQRWRPLVCHRIIRGYERPKCQVRYLLTLAIESSCDDSSVALLDTGTPYGYGSVTQGNPATQARLLFHEKITAVNRQWRGIHPLHSLEAHELNLPKLVHAALTDHGRVHRTPDLVAATRGPGMLSSLRTGMNLAKGLSLAWDVPFIGVHHMQAHALTPRLEEALNTPANAANGWRPAFPFLSVLVSGGHTLLLQSNAIDAHQELATTNDIAIGDCLDKIARSILPDAVLDTIPDAGYARLLEAYAFPTGAESYDYEAPRRREEEVAERVTEWGWSLKPPLIHTREMKFSFSGLDSAVKRIVQQRGDALGEEERRCLAQKAMEAAFESLGSRIMLAFEGQIRDRRIPPSTVVLSGGVASNKFLRKVVRSFLNVRGYADVVLVCPRPELCTDNAAMIAWAGFEMFAAGWTSDRAKSPPIAKWPLSPRPDGSGGILGVDGWIHA